MAISISLVDRISMGNARGVVAEITLDGSYASGGYAVAASDFGLSSLDFLSTHFKTGENLLSQYSASSGKIEILKGASTVTVTSGNAAFTELATNDTLISSSSILRVFAIGNVVNKG